MLLNANCFILRCIVKYPEKCESQIYGEICAPFQRVLAKKIANFEERLPSPQSELAAQTMKAPYVFDFIPFKEDMVERDIEQALVKDVTKLLLELGTGICFFLETNIT